METPTPNNAPLTLFDLPGDADGDLAAVADAPEASAEEAPEIEAEEELSDVDACEQQIQLFLNDTSLDAQIRINRLNNFLQASIMNRRYSPFNAALLTVQVPSGELFLTPARWARFGRRIKFDAPGQVILRPRGPVMFVWEYGDTEADPAATAAGKKVFEFAEITKPPAPPNAEKMYQRACEKAYQLGVKVEERHYGEILYGLTAPVSSSPVRITKKKYTYTYHRPYTITIADTLPIAQKLGTLAHELGHALCGHVSLPEGIPHEEKPRGTHLDRDRVELEAELTSYLVCQRLNIPTSAREYLLPYLDRAESTTALPPNINLVAIAKSARLIEQLFTNKPPTELPKFLNKIVEKKLLDAAGEEDRHAGSGSGDSGRISSGDDSGGISSDVSGGSMGSLRREDGENQAVPGQLIVLKERRRAG